MLSVVGTGYAVAGQVTVEAQALMEGAEALLYLVSDPATAAWLQGLNPGAESLAGSYREGGGGLAASEEMVGRILAPLRRGLRVCAAFSGHPAVYLHTSHAAVRRAREEGYRASMLPGVSCEDCLIADLGVDPAVHGRSLFEATDFLLRRRRFDTASPLVLLQVGAIGLATFRRGSEPNRRGLAVLAEVLRRHYPADHQVTVYEAGQPPLFEPRVERVPLERLAEAGVTVVSTLYVPPSREAPADPEMLERLRLTP